jgi:hypothetical protein
MFTPAKMLIMMGGVVLVNLLGDYGNFGTDSDSDGLADGWAIPVGGSLSSKSIADNKQTFTPSSLYGGIFALTTQVSTNDILYACAKIATTGANVHLVVNSYDSGIGTTMQVPPSGVSSFVSVLQATNHTIMRIVIQNRNSSDYKAIIAEKVFWFNLTKAFGAGNEPSQATMDTFMQAAIAQGYFVQRVYGGV